MLPGGQRSGGRGIAPGDRASFLFLRRHELIGSIQPAQVRISRFPLLCWLDSQEHLGTKPFAHAQTGILSLFILGGLHFGFEYGMDFRCLTSANVYAMLFQVPKTKTSVKRSCVLAFRVTPEQLSVLELKAGKCRLPVALWIRALILKHAGLEPKL